MRLRLRLTVRQLMILVAIMAVILALGLGSEKMRKRQAYCREADKLLAEREKRFREDADREDSWAADHRRFADKLRKKLMEFEPLVRKPDPRDPVESQILRNVVESRNSINHEIDQMMDLAAFKTEFAEEYRACAADCARLRSQFEYAAWCPWAHLPTVASDGFKSISRRLHSRVERRLRSRSTMAPRAASHAL